MAQQNQKVRRPTLTISITEVDEEPEDFGAALLGSSVGRAFDKADFPKEFGEPPKPKRRKRKNDEQD
tara:strand:- start:410 stop:610 length:201 start_codon:yes stop_codon:yes gene_type:complete